MDQPLPNLVPLSDDELSSVSGGFDTRGLEPSTNVHDWTMWENAVRRATAAGVIF